MKRKVIILILLCVILISSTYIFHIYHTKSSLSLILKGDDRVFLNLGQEYIEDGYHAYDSKEGDVSKKVQIHDTTNSSLAGTYIRTYTIKNTKGMQVVKTRTIVVKEKQVPIWKEAYQSIDNTKKGWWSGNKKNGTRPLGGEKEENLLPYQAYFLGKDEKVLYLTFDEGSNDTYMKEIVDVLNRNQVKATFFLCKQYILDNKELMRTLEENGHSVGNHTAHHLNMPTYAEKDSFSKYISELEETEKAYYSVTGKPMDKVYREPRGEWSFRSLAIVKDLGYTSYFWSADYLDWDKTVTKEYAFSELKKRAHNGAIYLIHPKNKGNYEAMDLFIKTMKKEGYRFDLVKNIPL